MDEQVTNGAYNVVWPLGRRLPIDVVKSSYAASLDGARIGFIWDYLFCGEEIFAEVKSQLQERYHDVTFVGPEVFGNVHGPDEEELIRALPGIILASGVTSVVVAVGA